jgi:hypothetical protein
MILGVPRGAQPIGPEAISDNEKPYNFGRSKCRKFQLEGNCELWMGVLSVWPLALIGNASLHSSWGGAESRSEAFSITRLEGSRWCLRRTRGAMGFESTLG